VIAIDTNVLVRFLVRDDEKQAQAVYKRLKQAEKARESLFVPLVVLLETIWVLESAYDKSRAEVQDAIRDMRRMPVFELEKDDAVERMLSDKEAGKTDLADLLIVHAAKSCGCDAGITFDKRAARHSFYRLLK